MKPLLTAYKVLATVVGLSIITLIVIVGNLVVDLLYAVLDPRVGRETGRGRPKALAGGII